MVQCEMCGKDIPSPKTIKVEGAELDVCNDCAEFGTEVKTQSTSSTSTKYSTGGGSSSSGSTSGSTGSATSTTSGGTTGGSSRSRDMFDDLEEVAQDYDDRIRKGREKQGLTQEELANKLNEKASLIRKLEQGQTLPSDDIQSKLESALDISLSAGGIDEDTDWDGSSTAGETTLGDVVERKD